MQEIKNRIRQITIIGAGSWGTAIAKVIAENRPNLVVKMWAYEKATVHSINQKNINSEFLPGIKLPLNIKATIHLRDSLLNTDGIIIATPSKVLPDTIAKIGRNLSSDVPVAYLTKGFCRYNNEILTISQAIGKILPAYKERIVGIYGPSHAEEVVKYFHTCIAVAGKTEADRKFFCELLNCDFFQCREVEDILGVDLGGTLKNPAAIAAGMISIFPRCGDNLEGALIAESLKEMERLGVVLGASPDTIIDITGTGDLVATALSEHSRNRRFGKDVATKIIEKGTTLSVADRIYLRFKPEYVLEKISSNFHYLAEGAYAIEPLIELADKYSIPIPVYRSLYEVLLNKKEPSLLIETIKNPDKFDEIYNNAKLLVKDKKRGLETLKGKAFIKIITQSVLDKFKQEYNTEELKDFLITNLKGSLSTKDPIKKELKYISSLNHSNFDKIFRKLTSIYLNETIDHNNLLFNKFLFNLMSMVSILRRINGKKNKIKITGDLNKIRNLKERVNTIYVTRFKNLYDFCYYFYSIQKKYLPIPRFFIPSEAAGGLIKKFLLKKSGGYIIHNTRFNNILYRECVSQYLTALISHGVPILFFPEIEPETSSRISPVNEDFFTLLNTVMYQESTEIVLIPAQLSYRTRLNEKQAVKTFTDQVIINFSSPVFLSNFTDKVHADTEVSEVIKETWLNDDIILPQHIICGIMSEKNNIIKAGKLKKYIDRYIDEKQLPVNLSRKKILHDGVKFLVKNNIVKRNDEYLIAIQPEIISRYAEIAARKFIKK